MTFVSIWRRKSSIASSSTVPRTPKPALATLLPRVISEVQRLAPGVTVEWLAPGTQTIAAVAEGQIDLALVTAAAAVPDGVQRHAAGELHSVTFARKGHPAIASWGTAAWTRWPHVQVQLGERAKGSVDSAAEEQGLKRTISASVPNFSQVPALVAQTNLLATMTPLVMDGAMERFGIRALEPPIPVKPTAFSFLWSFRLASDPGSRWLRTLVMDAYTDLQRKVALMTSGRNLVKARTRGREPGVPVGDRTRLGSRFPHSGRRG